MFTNGLVSVSFRGCASCHQLQDRLTKRYAGSPVVERVGPADSPVFDGPSSMDQKQALFECRTDPLLSGERKKEAGFLANLSTTSIT